MISLKKVSKTTKKIKNNTLLRISFWFFPGLFIGLFVPWYFYLHSIVNNLFVDYNWSIPSLVYARDLNLYKGKTINSKELLFELNALGYKKKDKVMSIGEYSYTSNAIEIMTKGFNFFDAEETSKHISFRLEGNKIIQINPSLVRLEPLLIGQFYSKKYENRNPIKLSQIPNTMVMGLQAIEDRNFKHHTGVDVFGIVRAMVRNLFAGKIIQGGSTITQQLIKNRLHYRSKSWLRKVNEAIAALMLENKWDKGKIIESYFNEIYWGQKGGVAIHGVSQAARYYFSKQPDQLNLHEQALLIAIAKGPSWYHPIKHKKRALNRRNSVLNSWYETSIITKSQWLKAKQSGLDLSVSHALLSQTYKDIIDYVKVQIGENFSNNQLNKSGLKIFTTANPFLQNQLQNTLVSSTSSLGKNVQAAAVICEAKSGKIAAIKGSKEPYSYFNRALLSKRQIGSLIKPFVYLAALELLPSFKLSNVLEDKELKIKTSRGEYWQPKNWDHKSLGEISAFEALIHSRNQATVFLGLKIGVNKFIHFLSGLGLTINRSIHPSIFLGATELTVTEVTNLFLIISSNARAQHLQIIKHIVDKENKVVGKLRRQNNLNLNEKHLNAIKQAMHEVTIRGTAAKLNYHFGFKNLYGKTGTTNQGKNSWFVGFDDQYLATFWVGKDNNTATKLTGSSGAMLLWAYWYKSISNL